MLQRRRVSVRVQTLGPVALLVLAGAARAQLDDPFPPVFELSSLLPSGGGNGTLGTAYNGASANDESATSVAFVGDLNGDGLDDVAVGAPYSRPGGRINAGQAYIVFGRASGAPAELELAALDGTNGFRIEGARAGDRAGIAVAGAGDVNGDGLDDLVLGANGGDSGIAEGGETYVIFGRRTPFPAALGLGAIDGTNGFRVTGIGNLDGSGSVVAGAGDMNGDGVSDFAIGAPLANAGGLNNAGQAYVVFGRRTAFPSSFSLSTLDGTNGFRLDGVTATDYTGRAVACIGDLNGDGVDDLAVGAPNGDAGNRSNSGETYVVFGRAGAFPPSILLSSLDGDTGYRLDGVEAGDNSGAAVAPAGDLNGDGLADLAVGAPSTSPGGRRGAGTTYVVFGRTGDYPVRLMLSSLNGANGFRIEGVDAGDTSGSSLDSVADVNGDGLDDLLIGAYLTAPGGRSQCGAAFVVYGRTGSYPASFQLSSLDGASGFRLHGIDAGDWAARAVGGRGDANGDGAGDLLIGAPQADPGGRSLAGEACLVLGRRAAPACPADFNGDGAVDSDDFFDFLNAYFAGDTGADFNRDGTVDSDDFFDFLNAYYTGC